jgi:hypothetical protein
MTESVTVTSILLDDLADLIYTPYIVLKMDIGMFYSFLTGND